MPQVKGRDGAAHPVDVPRFSCYIVNLYHPAVAVRVKWESKMVRQAWFFPAVLVLTCIAFAGLLTLGTSPEAGSASFPGFNGKIVFDSGRAGQYDIFVMDPDGHNQVNITNTSAPGQDEYGPRFSADGQRIVFYGNDGIFTMDSNGGNRSGILADGIFPAWSPDGAKIAYSSSVTGDANIWVMDADGGNQAQLSNGNFDNNPDWSPDGSKIAFERNDEIYVMDADGANPVNLSNDPAEDDSPRWSPDGSMIAFMSKRDGNAEIYVMDANGGNPANLTNTAAKEDFPTWSPDRSKIAYQQNGASTKDIFVMDANGSNQHKITNGVGDGDEKPDWQPLESTPTPTPSPTPSPTPTRTPTPTPTHSTSSSLTQGDVDCSGEVNLDDSLLLLQFAAGVHDGTTPGACPDLGGILAAGGIPNHWGDVNCDGHVDTVDALNVLAFPDFELPHPGCRDIGQAL